MQKRMNSRVPAVTASLFALAFAFHPSSLLAASDCLDQPNQAVSGHWHYHLDRTSGRKCWYLVGAEPAAKPPQADTPARQPAPEPAQQPPAFSSFFSSLTSGFTTASTPQPDPPARDARGAIAQPEAAKGDDASKRRQRADAKPAPVPKPDRQASSRPARDGADQPRPASVDQAERDRLFEEFLRWRERQ